MKNHPNITNGFRHIFQKIKDAQDFFRNDNDGWDVFIKRMMNNCFFLHVEHFILALLSDERRPKRRLGKKLILQARLQRTPQIRYFQKTLLHELNLNANDYSEFLDYKSLPEITEPPVTFNKTEQQLDDVVDGTISIIELCDLKDVYCHTQVIVFALSLSMTEGRHRGSGSYL